ncbi:hypothetical protein D3C85_1592980 [compost metagenome]
MRILYGNKNLSESDALRLEQECIGSISQLCYQFSKKDGVYNKVIPKEYCYWDTDFYEHSEFAIDNCASYKNCRKYMIEQGWIEEEEPDYGEW